MILLLFSSCAFLPYYRAPSKITVDGITYVKFEPRLLYVLGLQGHDESTALFRRNNHNWWRLKNGPFDMYYAQHTDAQFWRPVLFFREGQKKIVAAYYENTDNFTYYIGRYYDENGDIPSVRKDDNVILEALKKTEKLEKFILAGENDKFVSMEQKKFRNGAFVWEHSEIFTIYRNSNDGLFCTLHARWSYYDGIVYRWDSWLDETNELIVKTLPDDENEYIVSLLKEYRLTEKNESAQQAFD